MGNTIKIVEHSRENLIKLMQKMADVSHSSADDFEDVDPEFSKFMRNNATQREMFLHLLQDENYFTALWKIYMED